MEFWLMRWVWEKPFKPYPCWLHEAFSQCVWTPHGPCTQVNPCQLDERVQEVVSYPQGCLFDWRPRNAKCVHQGCHDARRLGCCRHQLRDDSKRKECVQEVQLEVHGD